MDDPNQGTGNEALLGKGAHCLNPADFQIDTLDLHSPQSNEPAGPKEAEEGTGNALTELSPANSLEESHAPGKSIFDAFLAEIEPILRTEPATPALVAELLSLNPTQTKTWLKQAEKLDRVVVNGSRPLKYRWNDHQGSQGSLFEKFQDSH